MKANGIMWFILGAAAGAMAGVLLAPDKGSKTRENLLKKGKKISADIGEGINTQINNVKGHISNLADDISHRLSRLEEELKRKTVAQKPLNKATEKISES